MRLHCPACNRAILSRRGKFCGFCQNLLPTGLLFSPADIEEDKEEALHPEVLPSNEPSSERGSPSGLKPTLRQLMILVVWASLLTAGARALNRWGVFGTTPESLCQNIPIYLGIYPVPVLAGLLWLLDRPGPVRNWYMSTSMIAGCFLGGVVCSLADPVSYYLTGKTTIIFPMWLIMGLVGFWCGWMQWRSARPRDCPACGRRSVIPIAVPTRLGSRRKYSTGNHGWCASCGASCERNFDREWRLSDPTV